MAIASQGLMILHFNSRPYTRGDLEHLFHHAMHADFNSRPYTRGDDVLVLVKHGVDKFQLPPLHEGRQKQTIILSIFAV